MKTVICPYCGKQAIYVDSKVVYGRSYGMLYLCRPCNAYVGCHKGTDQPLGRLADAELRKWKRAAHSAFDPLWKHGRFKGYRNVAYAWLAKRMGLPAQSAHIGMFDVDECKKVIKICLLERRTK